MYSVLVPFDRDEERAVAQGEMVLRLPDVERSAEVVLLHVADDTGRERRNFSGDPDIDVGSSSADGSSGDTVAQTEASDPIELAAGRRLHEMLTDAGVDVQVERRTGDPAEQILAVAKEFAVDQIVLGGRKRSPLGTLLFGSVTQEVILDADRPVTVTGADIKEEPSHRCRNCGESYYSNPERDIAQCRRCGGTHVETLRTPAR